MPDLELLVEENIYRDSDLKCYIPLPLDAETVDDLNGSTLHVTLRDIDSADILGNFSVPLKLVLDNEKPRGMAQFIADV